MGFKVMLADRQTNGLEGNVSGGGGGGGAYRMLLLYPVAPLK